MPFLFISTIANVYVDEYNNSRLQHLNYNITVTT